jgi:hypothetical protein
MQASFGEKNQKFAKKTEIPDKNFQTEKAYFSVIKQIASKKIASLFHKLLLHQNTQSTSSKITIRRIHIGTN